MWLFLITVGLFVYVDWWPQGMKVPELKEILGQAGLSQAGLKAGLYTCSFLF